MRVLIIGSDVSILRSDSASAKRVAEYGTLVKEIRIIIRSRAADGFEKPVRISQNVVAYPTNSKKPLHFFRDAYLIGRSVIEGNGVPPSSVADIKRVRRFSPRRVLAGLLGTGKIAEKSAAEENRWLITAQDPFESGLVAYRLARAFNCPLELQVHTDFTSNFFWKESWRNKLKVILAEHLLRRADCIRVVSERIKRGILQTKLIKVEIPISVLPIFVEGGVRKTEKRIEDVKTKSAKTPEPTVRERFIRHNFIFLMASRLTTEKNILMALKSFRDVIGTYGNALLLIIGDGPERNRLESLVREWRIDANVRFEGWQENLVPYYRAADCYLLTSNYEGYGRTLIEAQLHGVPVITTDVGCAGETIIDGDGAIIIPVADVKELVRRIKQFLENEPMREALKLRTRAIRDRIPTKEEFLKRLKENWLTCGK